MNGKLIYKGKTKDVYEREDGLVDLLYKDDATGKDGVFDPGENQVGLTIKGMGKLSLRVASYFFEILAEKGFNTHMTTFDIAKNTMTVKKARMFGNGLEFVCRLVATGSFVRRYGQYVEEGQKLDRLFEVTIKDDKAGDPLITEDTLAALGLMTPEQYKSVREATRSIAGIVAEILDAKGIALYDMKLEFGVDEAGEIMLIDEISAGCMRCYKNGRILDPIEMSGLILR